MTTFRRGGRPGSRPGPRRKTRWVDEEIDMTFTSTIQLNQDLTANIIDSDKPGMTLIRMIGYLQFVMVVQSTGGILSMGITPANQDALAAGALPDAEVDVDQPGWLWRAQRNVFLNQSAAGMQDQVNVEFDLRSRRKLTSTGDNIVFVATYVGLNNVNLDGMIRSLYLLP